MKKLGKHKRIVGICLCIALILSFSGCIQKDKSNIKKADYKTYIGYDEQFLAAEAAYLSEEGYIDSADIPEMMDEVEQLVQQGVSAGDIAHYNRDEGSIFIKFTSGIPYLFIPYEKGVLSGGGGGRILTLEPNEDDFSVNFSEVLASVVAKRQGIKYEEALYPTTNARLIAENFPDLYTYDYRLGNRYDVVDPFLGTGSSLRNTNVTIESMKKLADYKVIIWEGHGGYNEEIHSCLITGESFVGWKAFSKYKEDMDADRIVLSSFPTVTDAEIPYSPVRYYGITSKFVDEYIGEMDGNLLFLGACSSLKDDVLAESFINRGASVVMGYTENTPMIYEMISRTVFFDEMMKKSDAGFPTIAQAYRNTMNVVSTEGKCRLSYLTQSGMDMRYTLNGILEAPPVPKQLTKIKEYDQSGNLELEKSVYYNDHGQITKTTFDHISYQRAEAFVYDDQDRLIEYHHDSGEYSNYFTYNDIGQVIEADLNFGREWYEYDADGKLITIKGQNDARNYVTINHYDSGKLTKAITKNTPIDGDAYTETTTYSYDMEDRLVHEETVDKYSKLSHKYDYSFTNLVLDEYSINGERSSITLEYSDVSGNNACGSISLKNPQFYADKDGYLAKIVDTYTQGGKIETFTYEFYYDDQAAVPLSDVTNTSITHNAVVKHTYDEAEKLLYKYLGEEHGFDGMELHQVKMAGHAGTQFQMTLSGEGGTPVYLVKWYTVNLDTGEVSDAHTYEKVCDLW